MSNTIPAVHSQNSVAVPNSSNFCSCLLAWVPQFISDFGVWLITALEKSWSWIISSCSSIFSPSNPAPAQVESSNISPSTLNRPVAIETENRDLSNALEVLSFRGIRTGQNVTTVATGSPPLEELARHLSMLHADGLLTPEIREALRVSQDRATLMREYYERPVSIALRALHRAGIQTCDNREAVQRSTAPVELALVLKQAHEDNDHVILRSREALIASSDPITTYQELLTLMT